jgi:hypothetical protein
VPGLRDGERVARELGAQSGQLVDQVKHKSSVRPCTIVYCSVSRYRVGP